MIGNKSGHGNPFVLLTIILAGEAIFFLPFVLARIFRPTLLRVLEITNLELGLAFSVYGIIAMASYFFGGPLADKFAARKLMAYALWATGFGGFLMILMPNSDYLGPLYGYWGFTSIFLFWAAMIRATREWGEESFQGRAFGYLEGGRGLTAALIGTFVLFIFSTSSGEEGHEAFEIVILITSFIVLASGGLIWLILPSFSHLKTSTTNLIFDSNLTEVIKMPAVWMQGIIIICAYVGYKSTDDYSLYANQVLGFDEVSSAGVGTAALWLRPIFAIFAGILADRFRGSQVVLWSFILMLIGSLIVYLGIFEHITPLILVTLASTLIGVYGIRGIYFALMKESEVPLAATGTAVGIMSVVGFTPDIFMSPLMGYLLDSYPGSQGHRYVFLVLAIFSIIGLLTSILFRRYSQRYQVIEKN